MQENESTTKRWAAQLAGVLLVVLLAGAANASTFSVATEKSNLTWQTASSVLPILGNLPTSPVTSLRWRPHGYPTIMGTGSNPVSLTIQPGLINQPAYTAILPIPSLPSYVQFTTGLAAYAPNGGPATFKPGTKVSRPANFSWCPGAAANPACTTVLAGGAQGSLSGIIKYTSGVTGPQFGGTMKVLNSGVFSWFTVEATLPTYKVRLNNEGAGTATVAAGPGYSHYVSASAGAGDKIFDSPPFVPTYSGAYSIITNPGAPASTVPGDSSIGWGMPFTTGTVYIKVPFYPGPYLTITGMGEDNRTALGLGPDGTGNITMVAGGILTAPGGGATFPQILTFTIQVPEPSRVLMLASGVGLLGLLALVRRRTSA
jgi:hypothetical protein